MAYEFKKLNDVEIVETPIDTVNVLIEEDGVIKKAPKSAVGGGGIEVASAEVGQTIVVKAVDENGKPTEWECVDMSSDKYAISNEEAQRNNGVNNPWIVNKEIYDICVNSLNSNIPFIPNITMIFNDGMNDYLRTPTSLCLSNDNDNESYLHITLVSDNLAYYVFPDEEKLQAYWQYEMN